ncbi:MAG TPA: lipopolysaccharide assembly protein LapA domain-containing protein [Anaerolineaceae bacterium]|nr:lipopolysaccharide assembly protein LapA domain-containing protein [Anaerolineaceae bacterium]
MLAFVILALIVAALAVVFALQNPTTVTVTFLIWSFQGSLALILLGAVAIGLLICLLATSPGLIRSRWAAGSHRKKASALEVQRDEYKARAEKAESEVKDLELQLASLSAEIERTHSQESGDQPALPPA